MSTIKPEWITEFFRDNEDFYCIGEPGSIYIDGHLSQQALANFFNRKLADEIREPGEDWQPTAENINSLPRGIKDYVCGLETLCDPQYMIRANMIMKDLIRQLEAKILQEKK